MCAGFRAQAQWLRQTGGLVAMAQPHTLKVASSILVRCIFLLRGCRGAWLVVRAQLAEFCISFVGSPSAIIR